MILDAIPKLKPLKEEDSLPKALALLAARENRVMVTTERAARLLGKSRDTIYRWLEEGRLSGRKIGGRWLVYQDTIEAQWDEGLVERE